MRVMIIVPAFAPTEDGDPPTVGGKIARFEAASSPGMRGGIDEPCEMQAGDGAREDSPEDEGKSADGEENHAEDADWNVVVFRDPDVKFIFREVGDVARECGRIVMHRFADENPAHMRPPLSVDGGMRVAFLVGVLMVDAVRGHPENRSEERR